MLSRKGYFIQPTIVRDMSDDARLVREDQFSRIVPVLRYSDIDDAIARANDSDYGLGGTVWGKDLDRAFWVAADLNGVAAGARFEDEKIWKDAGAIAHWLHEAALSLYPESDYARRWRR